MNISTLQGRAWDIAEAKGHHDALRTPDPDARCAALASLADVFTKLSAVAQHVKRHGIPASVVPVLDTMTLDVMNALAIWIRAVGNADFAPSPHYATLLRLVLVHTEVSEAIEAAHDAGLLAGELADIAIRVGDLAEERHINLSAAVVATLEKNLARPMYYGTPEEGKEDKA
jgi:NTP pyrophosphatase (non-canonical NTP hydrolase)